MTYLGKEHLNSFFKYILLIITSKGENLKI